MPRWFPLSIVLILGLVACGSEPAGQLGDETIDLALSGHWRVESRAVSHECPELGSLAPVEPGALEIRSLEGSVSMGRPGGESRRYVAESADRWRWQAVATIDGCDIEADAVWHLESISPTGFVAGYEATLTATGRNCAYQQRQCQVRFQVRGQR